MIEMNELCKTYNPIHALADSEFVFRLGGSRRMNQKDPNLIFINETTDWDFYCSYSNEIAEFLEKDGWTKTKSPKEYFDDEVVDIYKWAQGTLEVQVVLRRDSEFYRDVFESIDPEFYHKFLWKSSPSSPPPENIQPIFNQLFKTARAK